MKISENRGGSLLRRGLGGGTEAFSGGITTLGGITK